MKLKKIIGIIVIFVLTLIFISSFIIAEETATVDNVPAEGIETNKPIEIIRTESTELFKYEGNKRVLTIFGGTRYISEDGIMKPIEATRSLKNSNIKCIVEEDSDTIAECLDYNATSITLDIILKNTDKKDKMPVKLIGSVQERDLTNATNGFSKILKTKEQKNIDFSGAGDKKTITVNGNFLNGDKIHIGETSTTVELKDAETEILEDTHVQLLNPTTNFGSSIEVLVGLANNNTAWIKFNISLVPSGNVIDNAEYYIVCGQDSGNTGGTDTWRIYNTTNNTWKEENIIFNNAPFASINALQNTTKTFGDGIITRMNVTPAVKSSYSSNQHLSLAIYEIGTVDNNRGCTNSRSKEGAYENRHGLNITYSTIPGGGGGGGNQSNESGEGLPNQITKAEYNFTYDANGNLLQGINKYHEYNNFNQLVRVRDGNSSGSILEEYTYDYDGARIKKIAYEGNTNETTYYIGDFVQVINASGTYNFTYYYDNGILIAEEDQSGKKLFYHPDHLGSTTLVTNETGEEVETVFYLPFGDLDNSNSDKRYLYTGKEKDSTGLYYYGARYYDTNLMTFITPDQNIPNLYNPQDLNHYTYVRNNPYKYVDPSGQEPVISQLGSIKSVANQIRAIEVNNPTLNPRQVLSAVAAQYPSASGINSQQAKGEYNFDTRFVYTEQKGFIDLAHFFRNAKYPSYGLSFGGGYLVEGLQFVGFRGQLGSGFSYEDLPSNLLGTQFGRSVNLNDQLSKQYESFVYGLGGSDNPSQDIPNDILATLPQSQQSKTKLSTDKTKYTPFGKAVPKQQKSSLFNRVKSFFGGK